MNDATNTTKLTKVSNISEGDTIRHGVKTLTIASVSEPRKIGRKSLVSIRFADGSKTTAATDAYMRKVVS